MRFAALLVPLLTACLIETGSSGVVYDCNAVYSCPDFAWTWQSDGSVCANGLAEAEWSAFESAPAPPFSCPSSWTFDAQCIVRLPLEGCAE